MSDFHNFRHPAFAYPLPVFICTLQLLTCIMSDPFPFLRLPLELREQIYSLYFKPADRIHAPEFGEYGGGQYKFDFDIYRVNKQIKTEAEDVFRRENVFVRIETPWPQAGMLSIANSRIRHPILVYEACLLTTTVNSIARCE